MKTKQIYQELFFYLKMYNDTLRMVNLSTSIEEREAYRNCLEMDRNCLEMDRNCITGILEEMNVDKLIKCN